ncbi:MAG: Crp/Fnr family transcriptional regulator [Gammaproteobacteria bacterium]|nr:Crp/Fnr family transcriptional regulator [Gammaproteobacteria bacterium]
MACETDGGLVRIDTDDPGISDPATRDLASNLERLGCEKPGLLARKGSVVKYDHGVIVPSSDLSHLHLMLDGVIQIMHYSASGRSVLVHECRAGQPFGGCDMLGDERVPAQAVANDNVTALRFRGWNNLDAARNDAGFGLILLEHALSVASTLAGRLIELTVERARDRVRLELVRQARQNMLDEHAGLVEPAPTHLDLAIQVGSHREEVSREMSYLRRHALIERVGTALRVRVDALEELYQRGQV